MNDFIQRCDYDGLEAHYRFTCLIHAGSALTDAIDALPFAAYQQQLDEALERALAQLEGAQAQALFLRIRPDLDWRGAFHLQAAPPPATSEPFEEYSYPSPRHELPAPAFPEAGELYVAHPLNRSLQPGGVALYLLARTVAAFGRSLQARRPSVPVWLSCVREAFRMA